MACAELISHVLPIFAIIAQRRIPVLSQGFPVAPATVLMKCMCALLALLELLVEALYVIRVGQRALACVSCVERTPLKTIVDSTVVVELVFPCIFQQRRTWESEMRVTNISQVSLSSKHGLEMNLLCSCCCFLSVVRSRCQSIPPSQTISALRIVASAYQATKLGAKNSICKNVVSAQLPNTADWF